MSCLGTEMPLSIGLRMMKEFGGNSLETFDFGITVLPVLVMVVSLPIRR